MTNKRRNRRSTAGIVARRMLLITLTALLSCSFESAVAQAPSLDRGRVMLKHGAYKEALSVFEALLEKNPADLEALHGSLQVRIETGDYETAEVQAKQMLASQAGASLIRGDLAEIQFLTGRYKEAVAEFERAAKGLEGAGRLRAMLGQARSLRAQGRDQEATPVLEEFVRYYKTNLPQTPEELSCIARALVYLERFKDANDLYIDARQTDLSFVDAFVGQGELLNEKYNYPEAASLFQDALQLNGNSVAALVGLAQSKALTSSAEPRAAVEKALTINPNNVEALVLKARLDLEAERPQDANETITRALSVNPSSVTAIAVRAAFFYLSGKKTEYDQEISRALVVNPRAAALFEILAHFAVINRRYEDAVDFGRRAVELSPRLWSARTQLGIQLLRIGRIAEGRTELERAFEGDPFNVWAKNTLDLLDSMNDYQEVIRGPFLIKSAPKESGALLVYAADLLEDAHKKLSAKYRFTPQAPVLVELFPNHEDFAVRSLGLPGLGALGVCFGQVIAMDSPSARPPGQFNWGSTLWHEYAHVVTLQITDYRIPRWFSEGISVYEERRARPGWGDEWSLETLKAYIESRFVKIEDLDAAFIRPKSPEQIPLAYFQASMVCEFVDQQFGFDSILKMLKLYREGARTPEVFEKALGTKLDEFDRRFGEFLKAGTRNYVEALGSGLQRSGPPGETSREALEKTLSEKPNDYFAHLRMGTILKREGAAEQAIRHLRRAAELAPFYTGEGNPYMQLAELYEARGEKAEAAAVLEAFTRYNNTAAAALKRLAELRIDLGDKEGAVAALFTSFYVYPFEAALHKLAGDVYLELNRANEATREYRVVVALGPPDPAQAHYDLARSLEAGGKPAEARREVLKALEAAPGFEKAQELLLKLRGVN